MKRTTILLGVLTLMLPFKMAAQNGKGLYIGAGGFVASSWIINQNFYGEPEVDYGRKIGSGGGLSLGYHFNENLAVVSEFQLSTQGQKYTGTQTMPGANYEVDRDITLKYFHIPVFFKYAAGSEKAKFRFMIGPQFSFLRDATQTYLRNGKRLETAMVNLEGNKFTTDDEDINDRFLSNDISIAFDLGADFMFSDRLFMSTGFRLNYGFNDINDPAYRLPNGKGEYTASNNLWGGLYIGLNYFITGGESE